MKQLITSDNVNKEDVKGSPPLHVALTSNYYNQYNIVEYLIKFGADVDQKDSKGRTPLDIIISNVR